MNIDDKLLKFILRYHGLVIDFDGRYGGQCMDLYRQYAQEVLGFPQSPGVIGAKDVWNTYLSQYYTRIYNGPSNFPQPGDVIVWGSSYGPFGHIAVCLYANGSRIVDFSQNDPLSSPCHIQYHSYHGVLGWLRPKPQVTGGQYAILPEGHALKGLHGPADPGTWAWDQFNLLDVVRECSFESVKVLCPGTSGQQVQTMRDKGAKFIYARLFAKLDEVRGETLEARARWFVSEIIAECTLLYAAGVHHFEVHNEPNLIIEGLGSNWNNGTEFAVWFSYVVSLLKAAIPGIKLGFPGLSPGDTIPGVRQDSGVFFAQAQQAVMQADWLGFHTYYGGNGSQWPIMLEQINSFADANKGKVILVSEFSNNDVDAAKYDKGYEYKAFYAAGKLQLRPNVGALNVFVLWSSGAFQHETLVERDGSRSAIVSALSA